ncbi:helix-turn-helix domain-containing protein [Aquisalimonas lutea]|uniref:helix-turn-helix domain-containing protein n=1 Tax=Aquisalimonas lutea TaxID=1327750 RepID=UPI0025B2D726|nr:helix-turn-helix domain-containing protein [Aquisalimonas lutea]MDN3517524.1 helix-turn-helix domain-containing protein [Aquisalimonas lutea]
MRLNAWTPLSTPCWNSVAVEDFRADLTEVCGRFLVEPYQRQPRIAGGVSRAYLSRFEAAKVSLDAQSVTRDASMIRRDPGEHLFLIVQDEGHATISQGDTLSPLSPGDMFLVDSARPSAFISSGRRMRQLSLHIPRDEAVHRFGRACTGGVAIDTDDPLRQALQAVLKKLMQEQSHGASAPLGETFMDLLGAYFLARQRQSSPDDRRDDRILGRVRAVVHEHADDPDFDLCQLATVMGTSRRTLQRHLSRLGETARRLILDIRLERAHSRLATGRAATVTGGVAAVAYASGFNDLSYFYRAFRKRYGIPPGKVGRPPIC